MMKYFFVLSDEMQVDVAGLANGMYVLNVIDERRIVSIKKFVKN